MCVIFGDKEKGCLGWKVCGGWEEASVAAGDGFRPKQALRSCQLGLQTPALLANIFDSLAYGTN